MMKGYLTVFLALTLSALTGFILFLTYNVVQNGNRIRFECAVDIGMNAVLSEYHTQLFEQYSLLYVDASYLGSHPAVENVEERLRLYVEKNSTDILRRHNAPWGNLRVDEVKITSFETAAASGGASMRNQAVCYIEDRGTVREEAVMTNQKEELLLLDIANPMEEWRSIMDQLAQMELPLIQNDQGEWEEVPLSNPADWVYGLTGSDILYLAEADLQRISPVSIDSAALISHRGVMNGEASNRTYKRDEDLFLTYLFEKMGYFGELREESILCCQLEYVAEGKDSDLENMEAAAERILRWRFADNVRLALADGSLRAKAGEAANELLAVQLKNEFEDLVTESILYACAFLESVGDLRALYGYERVPLGKTSHQMSVDQVLNGNIYSCSGSAGLSYSQYLAGMLVLMDEEQLNLRAMDIMEMDIRFHGGNAGFCMDWCIERYEASITAGGNVASSMQLRRRYGYF